MVRLTSKDKSAATRGSRMEGEGAGATRAPRAPSVVRAPPVPGGMQNAPDRAPGLRLVGESYFPTLIFFRDLPNGPELNDAIKPAIYAWRDTEPSGIVRSNVAVEGSWHSPLDMGSRPEFAPLVREVQSHAECLFADLGYDPAFGPSLSNMWANVHPRHGYNRSHMHPNALWSGVYYVQSPPRSGRILFGDPRAQALNLRPFYRPERPVPPLAWTEVYYEAIEGRILFFPAWLRHEVEPNLASLEGRAGDRISVSFNFTQHRRGGEAAGQGGA
jgi:uncharacterized protein (TIGR02466 family)